MSAIFDDYTGSWPDRIRAEGWAQGFKEGFKQGFKEGFKEGRIEGGLRRVVSLQLKLRFPEQLDDATVAARFEGADADQLLRVAQVLGPAVTTWDQVEQALSGQAQPAISLQTEPSEQRRPRAR